MAAASVLDTSFIVAFFDEQDARHASARKAMAAARPAILGPEALVETLGVIKVKAGRIAAGAALEALVRLPNLQWDERSDILGSWRLQRQNPALSFVDAAVVACALRHRVGLLTYDHGQARVAKRLGK